MIKMYVDTSDTERSQEIIQFLLTKYYALSINTADEKIYICDDTSCLTEDIHRLHFITRVRLFKQIYAELKQQFKGKIIKAYATPITALDDGYRKELEKRLAHPSPSTYDHPVFDPNELS